MRGTHTNCQPQNLAAKNRLAVDRTILKAILKKQDVRAWNVPAIIRSSLLVIGLRDVLVNNKHAPRRKPFSSREKKNLRFVSKFIDTFYAGFVLLHYVTATLQTARGFPRVQYVVEF